MMDAMVGEVVAFLLKTHVCGCVRVTPWTAGFDRVGFPRSSLKSCAV